MEKEIIDRELERLHESFRINQINNAGDLGREILSAIQSFYDGSSVLPEITVSGKGTITLRERLAQVGAAGESYVAK
jgi:hypothetical protein